MIILSIFMHYFSILHLYQAPFLLFIVSEPLHLILGEDTHRPKQRNFLSPKRSVVWIRSFCRVFFHLPKNQELENDLENS